MTHNNIDLLSETEKVFVNMIISKVCEICNVSFEEIQEIDRHRKHLNPRRLISTFLYAKTNIPLKILEKIINKDHSTIIHSYNEHTTILETEEIYLTKQDKEYRILALKATETLKGYVCFSHGSDAKRKEAQARELAAVNLINYEYIYDILKLHSLSLGHLNNDHKINEFIRDCPLLQKPHNIVIRDE